MTWLDITLIVLLGFSVVAGWAKGMFRSAFGLAAVLLSVWAAGLWYLSLGNGIHFWTRLPSVTAAWVAFFLIYAAIHALASLLGALLGLGSRILPQPEVSRLAGALIAGYRAVIQGALVAIALATITHGSPRIVGGPVTGTVASIADPLLVKLAPSLPRTYQAFVGPRWLQSIRRPSTPAEPDSVPPDSAR